MVGLIGIAEVNKTGGGQSASEDFFYAYGPIGPQVTVVDRSLSEHCGVAIGQYRTTGNRKRAESTQPPAIVANVQVIPFLDGQLFRNFGRQPHLQLVAGDRHQSYLQNQWYTN